MLGQILQTPPIIKLKCKSKYKCIILGEGLPRAALGGGDHQHFDFFLKNFESLGRILFQTHQIIKLKYKYKDNHIYINVLLIESI